MYNPLAMLSTHLLAGIIKSPKLFVREYYERGMPDKKENFDFPILLTAYDKENEVEHSRAYFHLKQLGESRYAKLYDSEIKEDREKLFIAASQPAGCRIFINMLPAKWIPPVFLRNKIHGYMQNNLPWWNYNKTKQLHIHLKDRYGQLFLQLSWKANKAEVVLEEIENSKLCVTI